MLNGPETKKTLLIKDVLIKDVQIKVFEITFFPVILAEIHTFTNLFYWRG